MVNIKNNLKFSPDRHKRCVDKEIIHRYFKVGDHVFLKVKSRHNSLKIQVETEGIFKV
jgi:hypothetical protein